MGRKGRNRVRRERNNIDSSYDEYDSDDSSELEFVSTLDLIDRLATARADLMAYICRYALPIGEYLTTEALECLVGDD